MGACVYMCVSRCDMSMNLFTIYVTFYICIMDFSPVEFVYDFLKCKCFGIPCF